MSRTTPISIGLAQAKDDTNALISSWSDRRANFQTDDIKMIHTENEEKDFTRVAAT